VGDKLTFRLNRDGDPVEMTFEIVGMVDRTGDQMPAMITAPNYAPIDAFPTGLAPDTVNAVIDVDEDQVATLKRAMKDVPGAFVMETRLMNDLLNRFIQQFTSFPILVASLALIVGGIVIANSVALSTLERRREIGIMKAVGLQRERVLGMLLLENGVMGLIGGLIGVGIGSLILVGLLTGMFGGALQDAIPYLTALQLMGLCVVIALLAAILTAWGASGEKPLNVLRYE
jgi:ABC-type antimicrobial peptide transport system permease subunit